MLPKPKSKYSYCSVCKADYEDYLKVFSVLHSIFGQTPTKTDSKTTDSIPTSMKCAKKWRSRALTPSFSVRNIKVLNICNLSLQFSLRKPLFSILATLKNKPSTPFKAMNTSRSTIGCIRARLFTWSPTGTNKICRFCMRIRKELQLILHFLPSSDVQNRLKG